MKNERKGNFFARVRTVGNNAHLNRVQILAVSNTDRLVRCLGFGKRFGQFGFQTRGRHLYDLWIRRQCRHGTANKIQQQKGALSAIQVPFSKSPSSRILSHNFPFFASRVVIYCALRTMPSYWGFRMTAWRKISVAAGILLSSLLLATVVCGKKIDDSRCHAEFVEHGNDNGLYNTLQQLRVRLI
jgi:hypothetical protein